MPPAKGPPIQPVQLPASSSSSSANMMNGGRLGPPSQLPPPAAQQQHSNQGGPLEKSQPYMPHMNSNGRLPTFAQPTKLDGPPSHHLNQLPPPPTIRSSTASNVGPSHIDSILKMMTSKVDPLSAIAATPRTEVIEHHPVRAHKYIGLPPLFSQQPSKIKSLLH